MKTPQLILFVGVIWVATACGGRTAGVDGNASSSGSNATGGVGGNAGIAGTSNVGGNGGVGGAISSPVGLGGAGNNSATGGASPTGGSSSTGGVTSTGTGRSPVWSTAIGPAVCTTTNCGSTIDLMGHVIDCGFANCPQEICGKEAPNQCPAACSAKIDCKSAGNKNCGWIPDGCGGVIDCGTCPNGQCCGDCGKLIPNGVPNVCGALPPDAGGTQPQGCGSNDCGLTPVGIGGDSVLDCGPCCKPLTCEDWCPADSSGNIRDCSSTKDDLSTLGGRFYVLCRKPDGCSGTIDCYCLPA